MQEVYRGTLFELIPVEGREWKEAGLDREKLSCHTVPAKISANPTKMDFESALSGGAQALIPLCQSVLSRSYPLGEAFFFPPPSS